MKCCPACQRTFVEDKKFCDQDGARLVTEAHAVKHCPKCGRTFPEAAKFCQSDGTPLVSQAPSTQASEANSPTQNAPHTPTVIVPPTLSAPQTEAPPANAPTASTTPAAPAAAQTTIQPAPQVTPTPAPWGSPVPAAQQLSPSELILLRGDEFAAVAGTFGYRVELLHRQLNVKATEIGLAAQAAVFLAAEQAGNVRFEIKPKKALLGLKTINAVYASAGSTPPAWPANSLEFGLCHMVSFGTYEVEDLVYQLLEDDAASGWQQAVWIIKRGLIRRNLLVKEEIKHMKIFSTTHYRLPESTMQLAARMQTEPIKQMLSAAGQQRPDLWQALSEEISRGVGRRKEASSDTDISGPDFD